MNNISTPVSPARRVILGLALIFALAAFTVGGCVTSNDVFVDRFVTNTVTNIETNTVTNTNTNTVTNVITNTDRVIVTNTVTNVITNTDRVIVKVTNTVFIESLDNRHLTNTLFINEMTELQITLPLGEEVEDSNTITLRLLSDPSPSAQLGADYTLEHGYGGQEPITSLSSPRELTPTGEGFAVFLFDVPIVFDPNIRSATLEFTAANGEYLRYTIQVDSTLRWSRGDGTPSDPYIVTNVFQLQWISNDLAASYRLGSDIDASFTRLWNGGRGFVPLGYDSFDAPEGFTSFSGEFSGDNYSISHLYIDNTNSGNNNNDAALFISVTNREGSIRDVHFVSPSLTSTVGNVATVAITTHIALLSNVTVNEAQLVGHLNIAGLVVRFLAKNADAADGYESYFTTDFDPSRVISCSVQNSLIRDRVGAASGEIAGLFNRTSDTAGSGEANFSHHYQVLLSNCYVLNTSLISYSERGKDIGGFISTANHLSITHSCVDTLTAIVSSDDAIGIFVFRSIAAVAIDGGIRQYRTRPFIRSCFANNIFSYGNEIGLFVYQNNNSLAISDCYLNNQLGGIVARGENGLSILGDLNVGTSDGGYLYTSYVSNFLLVNSPTSDHPIFPGSGFAFYNTNNNFTNVLLGFSSEQLSDIADDNRITNADAFVMHLVWAAPELVTPTDSPLELNNDFFGHPTAKIVSSPILKDIYDVVSVAESQLTVNSNNVVTRAGGEAANQGYSDIFNGFSTSVWDFGGEGEFPVLKNMPEPFTPTYQRRNN